MLLLCVYRSCPMYHAERNVEMPKGKPVVLYRRIPDGVTVRRVALLCLHVYRLRRMADADS